MKKGLPHGQGTKKWANVDQSKLNQYVTYQGAWKEGKMEGFGELLMSMGETYRGEFV